MRVVSRLSCGRQRRQDRRQPPGEHRLAGAGRADHQDVVPAGGGDGQRPLGELLAADVGEIHVVAVQLRVEVVHAG